MLLNMAPNSTSSEVAISWQIFFDAKIVIYWAKLIILQGHLFFVTNEIMTCLINENEVNELTNTVQSISGGRLCHLKGSEGIQNFVIIIIITVVSSFQLSVIYV